MNKVWTRICPILGLLLLLSVCSLLCDSKVTCQENSDNSYFKQAKCISGSNSFPEGDGSGLNADLNRWCEGRNRYDFANSAKSPISGGKYSKYSRTQCQEQAKCIDGSNFFPEGDGGCLNAVLNRWCNGRCQRHIPAKNVHIKLKVITVGTK